MGIDESLALAVTAKSLQWLDHATRPIDRVAALSGASGLASDIFRAKHHDHAALHRAILLLSHKAEKQGKRHRMYLSASQAMNFAAAAFIELLNPACRSCLGASVIMTDKLKITCPTCSGTGVHRYADDERARNCGVDADRWHLWMRRYEMVIGLARGADNAAMGAAVRLG